MNRLPSDIAEEAVADLAWSSSGLLVKARGAEVVCETSWAGLDSEACPSKAAPAPESADSLINDDICFSLKTQMKKSIPITTHENTHEEYWVSGQHK